MYSFVLSVNKTMKKAINFQKACIWLQVSLNVIAQTASKLKEFARKLLCALQEEE